RTAPAVQPVVVPPAQETPVPAPVAPAPATGYASSILEQVTKAKMQAENDAILAALNSTRWNRKRAAKLLNIDYKTLLYKMKKLGRDDGPAPFVLVGEPPASILSACGD